MEARYYDRDGRPVSRTHWQQLSRQPGYCQIGYTTGITGGLEVTVATYWLGVTAAAGQPVIFHSYAEIRRLDAARPRWRQLWGWPGLAQAQAGHRGLVGWLPAQAAWLAGHGHPPGPPPSPASTPPPGTATAAG